MAIEFFMPKMSDHMDAGVIVAWLVKEGDRIEKGDALLEIETDSDLNREMFAQFKTELAGLAIQ